MGRERSMIATQLCELQSALTSVVVLITAPAFLLQLVCAPFIRSKRPERLSAPSTLRVELVPPFFTEACIARDSYRPRDTVIYRWVVHLVSLKAIGGSRGKGQDALTPVIVFLAGSS
jgi:hypothetical protein